MPTDFVSVLPALAGIIEKGGIIGVLLIACAVLALEVKRTRKAAARTYLERDVARLKAERYKARLEGENIVVDVSDLDRMLVEVQPA